MEVSIANLFLFIWGVVATVLWQVSVAKNTLMGRAVVSKFISIARGELKVVDTGESVEFYPITKEEK